MPADTGYGITISFASGFLAEIIGVTLPEMSRDEIDTSHTTTPNGARTFIMQDLVNFGELSVELNLNPSTVPPIHGNFEQCVITFPNGATWTFQGALKSYSAEAPIDDRMTATAVIKVSGPITQANA
jgi:hypothetical protein